MKEIQEDPHAEMVSALVSDWRKDNKNNMCFVAFSQLC